MYVLFAGVAALETDILAKLSTVIFLGLSIAAIIASCAGAKTGNGCKAFISSTLAIAFLTIGFFNALFPRYRARLFFEHLQRRIHSAYFNAYDGRGGGLRADCLNLSSLVV